MTPIFSTKVNGVSRRLVATAGKDGMLRALDRETHEVLYATPVTTRENADQPITTKPTRACPGVLGGVEWNGPAFNPGANLLYVPAVDWCATFTAFEEARYIPGKIYLGGTADLGPSEKSLRGTYCSRANLPETSSRSTAHWTRALPLQHRGLNGRRHHYIRGRRKAVHRSRLGKPVELLVDKYPGAPTIVVFALPTTNQ